MQNVKSALTVAFFKLCIQIWQFHNTIVLFCSFFKSLDPYFTFVLPHSSKKHKGSPSNSILETIQRPTTIHCLHSSFCEPLPSWLYLFILFIFPCFSHPKIDFHLLASFVLQHKVNNSDDS